MNKLLTFFLLLFATQAFAIEFFKPGDVISAAKMNEVINDAMKIHVKNGTSFFTTSSDTKILVPNRTLTVNKKYDQTDLLIKYTDVFRVNGADKMCTIYLEVDGKTCTNGANFKSMYTHTSLDINAMSISAACSGLPKGSYTVKVMVKDGAAINSGYNGAVCEFSWSDNSTFELSAQEILGN